MGGAVLQVHVCVCSCGAVRSNIWSGGAIRAKTYTLNKTRALTFPVHHMYKDIHQCISQEENLYMEINKIEVRAGRANVRLINRKGLRRQETGGRLRLLSYLKPSPMGPKDLGHCFATQGNWKMSSLGCSVVKNHERRTLLFRSVVVDRLKPLVHASCVRMLVGICAQQDAKLPRV